jgi:osmotically-inducible protein OsmY
MLKMKRLVRVVLCIALVTVFTGCASTRTQQSTGEYVDDTTITAKVKSAILTDSELKVLQINVETFKGVVQLSGFVNSAQSVKKAGEVAANVKGVVSVKNNLIVK